MKKTLPLILPVFLFLPTLLYLHQKVQIYAEAYRLNNNYQYSNVLIDKRDSLMYNFSKQVSLAKVNQWAHEQNFLPVERERRIAFNGEEPRKASNSKIALLFDRLLRASTSTSTALAKDKN